VLAPAGHHVLEEVPEELPHRHARQLHRAHHAQVYRRTFRSSVTPVVLDTLTHSGERTHLTFREVVVYRIVPVLPVSEQTVLEVVEV